MKRDREASYLLKVTKQAAKVRQSFIRVVGKVPDGKSLRNFSKNVTTREGNQPRIPAKKSRKIQNPNSLKLRSIAKVIHP